MLREKSIKLRKLEVNLSRSTLNNNRKIKLLGVVIDDALNLEAPISGVAKV